MCMFSNNYCYPTTVCGCHLRPRLRLFSAHTDYQSASSATFIT